MVFIAFRLFGQQPATWTHFAIKLSHTEKCPNFLRTPERKILVKVSINRSRDLKSPKRDLNYSTACYFNMAQGKQHWICCWCPWEKSHVYIQEQSFIPFYIFFVTSARHLKSNAGQVVCLLSSEREKKRHCQQERGRKGRSSEIPPSNDPSPVSAQRSSSVWLNSMLKRQLDFSASTYSFESKNTIKLHITTIGCYCIFFQANPFFFWKKAMSYFHHWLEKTSTETWVHLYSFRPWSWAYTQNIYLARD